MSTTFEAAGVPVLDSLDIPLRTDYVVGVRLEGDSIGLIAHEANEFRDGTMFRLARIPARVGQHPLGDRFIGLLQIRLEWTPNHFGSPYYYLLDEGTVTVTAVDRNGIRGRFNLTGKRIGPPQDLPGYIIHIRNGLFDVPIDPPGLEARGCWMFGC